MGTSLPSSRGGATGNGAAFSPVGRRRRQDEKTGSPRSRRTSYEYGRRAQLAGGNPYRARAYIRAAESLAAQTEPLGRLVAKKRLREIPGIGEAIAAVIEQLHRTGSHPLSFALAHAAVGADTDPMARLDTNQNRVLEESEAQAAGRQLFASLDQNGDGRIQLPEIEGRLGGPVVKAADVDADGALSFQEYAALLTARYKSANGNGLVDQSELSALTGQLLLVMVIP